MKGYQQRAVECLLFLAAVAWPLEVFQFVPHLGIGLVELATLGLMILALSDIASLRRPRISFELGWPLVIAAALQAEVVFPALLVAALAQLVRSRRLIENSLVISCFSAAICAALSLLSPFTHIIPTAYSLNSPATLTFASSLGSGALTLAIALIFSVYYTFFSKRSLRLRSLTAACGALLLAALVSLSFLLLRGASEWEHLSILDLPWRTMSCCLILFWLIARVAAKTQVDAVENGRQLHGLLLVVLIVSMVLAIGFAVVPTLGHVFVIGLVAAYALPKRNEELDSRFRGNDDQKRQARKQGAEAPCLEEEASASSALPVRAGKGLIALAAFALLSNNLNNVYLDNASDPRNFDNAARVDFEQGRFDEVSKSLDFWEGVSPTEPRVHLWRAKLELQRKRHLRASNEFVKAVRASDSTEHILPPPSKTEQMDFVVRLRDFCSSLGDVSASFAYERALVAMGGGEGAIASLELRVQKNLPVPDDCDVAPVAYSLAWLLGNVALAEPLEEWEKGRVLAAIELYGALIEKAPLDFPRENLPLAVVVRPTTHGTRSKGNAAITDSAGKGLIARAAATRLELMASMPGSNVRKQVFDGVKGMSRTDTQTLWDKRLWSIEESPQGTWILVLAVPPDNQRVLELEISKEGILTGNAHDASGFLPDASAVIVLLP